MSNKQYCTYSSIIYVVINIYSIFYFHVSELTNEETFEKETNDSFKKVYNFIITIFLVGADELDSVFIALNK